MGDGNAPFGLDLTTWRDLVSAFIALLMAVSAYLTWVTRKNGKG